MVKMSSFKGGFIVLASGPRTYRAQYLFSTVASPGSLVVKVATIKGACHRNMNSKDGAHHAAAKKQSKKGRHDIRKSPQQT